MLCWPLLKPPIRFRVRNSCRTTTGSSFHSAMYPFYAHFRDPTLHVRAAATELSSLLVQLSIGFYFLRLLLAIEPNGPIPWASVRFGALLQIQHLRWKVTNVCPSAWTLTVRSSQQSLLGPSTDDFCTRVDRSDELLIHYSTIRWETVYLFSPFTPRSRARWCFFFTELR